MTMWHSLGDMPWPALAWLSGREPLADVSVGARLQLLLASAFMVAAPYFRLTVAHAKPGWQRLVLSVPLFAFNLACGIVMDNYDEVMLRGMLLFTVSWLANMKVLGFCMNRGPLAARWNFVQTALIMYLPVYPAPTGAALKEASGRLNETAPHPWIQAFIWPFKVTVFCYIVILLMSGIGGFYRDIIMVTGMYCFIGILMDGPCSIIMVWLGVDIIPTFDPPWLSTSFADFWGRRWNITTSHLLRATVHEPISEGCFVYSPMKKVVKSRNSRKLGILATFLVSGLVHELIFWLVLPSGKILGKWFVYFTMQGPLLLVEHAIKRAAKKRRIVLNAWASRAISLPLLLLVGHYGFFVPATDDTNLAERFVRSAIIIMGWCGLPTGSYGL